MKPKNASHGKKITFDLEKHLIYKSSNFRVVSFQRHMLVVTAYHLHQGSIGNLGVVGMLRFVQIQPIKAALILSRVAVKHIATNTYLVLSHVC